MATAKICIKCKHFELLGGDNIETAKFGYCESPHVCQTDFRGQTPINGISYGSENELYGVDLNEFYMVGINYGCIHFVKRKN